MSAPGNDDQHDHQSSNSFQSRIVLPNDGNNDPRLARSQTGGSEQTGSRGGLQSREAETTSRIRDQQVIPLPSSSVQTVPEPSQTSVVSEPVIAQPSPAPVINVHVTTSPGPTEDTNLNRYNTTGEKMPPPPAGVILADDDGIVAHQKPTVIEPLPEDSLSPWQIDTPDDDMTVVPPNPKPAMAPGAALQAPSTATGEPSTPTAAVPIQPVAGADKAAPWKQKKHHLQTSRSKEGGRLPHSSEKDDGPHSMGSGRVISEYGSRSYKRFLASFGLIGLILLVIGSLVHGSYTGWLERTPVPKAVPFTIQMALARFGLPPSNRLILVQSAEAMREVGQIKHHVIVSSNADGESFSGTISGVSSPDMQFMVLESKFIYQTSNQESELSLDMNKTGPDYYMQFNQNNSAFESVQLEPINDQWLRLALNPNSSNGARALPGEQALSSIRNQHLADLGNEMLEHFIVNARLLTEHDFSTTHFVLEYTLPRDRVTEFLSRMLNEFNQSKVRQTYTQGELEDYISDVTGALPEYMTVRVLINRSTKLVETVTVNGQLNVDGRRHTVQIAYTPTYQDSSFTTVPAPASSESSNTVVWESLLRHPLLRGLVIILQ